MRYTVYIVFVGNIVCVIENLELADTTQSHSEHVEP